MNIEFENYLLLPHATVNEKAKLFELKASQGYKNNSVAIIPYQNPNKKQLKINYYSILSSTIIDFDNKSFELPEILFQSKTSKARYIKIIKELKNEIQLGNVYEINYCLQFFANNVSIQPLQVFHDLIKVTKAPYSALLKIGDEFIICCSPELFLKKEGQLLFTKPIKGTSKRGLNETDDHQLKKTLFESIKERTENVMAVDVARNDLSKIAQRASVNVNQLYNIETFETVHQMVSTVNCKVNEGTTFEEIIDATFPMASMTGAPKISAMNLIDKYEEFERQHYSGTFGLIDENGNFELPVVIRSIFYNQKTKKIWIAAGGAITYLSEAEQEYEEVLLKLRAQLTALNAKIEN